MKDQNFFPHVISFEHRPKQKENTISVQQVADAIHEISLDAIHEISLKGVVSKDGKFLFDPGGMNIEHSSIGVYKITHNLGYTNTSISVSIMEPPGSLLLKEHHPNYFIVEAYLDAQLTDMDWCFTLMRTL